MFTNTYLSNHLRLIVGSSFPFTHKLTLPPFRIMLTRRPHSPFHQNLTPALVLITQNLILFTFVHSPIHKSKLTRLPCHFILSLTLPPINHPLFSHQYARTHTCKHIIRIAKTHYHFHPSTFPPFMLLRYFLSPLSHLPLTPCVYEFTNLSILPLSILLSRSSHLLPHLPPTVYFLACYQPALPPTHPPNHLPT